MKGALVTGAITHVERETLFVQRAVLLKAACLQPLGSIAQPVMPSQALDQYFLGLGFRTVLVLECEQQLVVGFGTFVREKRESVLSVARPWVMRLRDEAALPSLVLGPVESCEFARLAAICAEVDIFRRSPSRVSLRHGRATEGYSSRQAIEERGNRDLARIVTDAAV